MKKFGAVVVAVMLFSACGNKGSNDVNHEGDCTRSFIEDYNDMVKKFSDASGKEASIDTLLQLDQECTQFFKEHGSMPGCQAANRTTQKAQTVTVDGFKTDCENIRSLIN